jgi:hypothetical protein
MKVIGNIVDFYEFKNNSKRTEYIVISILDKEGRIIVTDSVS